VFFGTHLVAMDLVNGAFPDIAKTVRIADVGCGRGWVVKHLRDSGYMAAGFEYGKGAVEHSVCGADWCDLTESLPIENAECGLVICHGVLSHVGEEKAAHAVKELARITFKRGLVWTNILTGWHEQQQHHLTFRPKEWWEHRFKAAGLKWDLGKQAWLRERGYDTRKRQWSAVWVKA
jgi:SAM-dependent methyltransferase